MEWFEIRSWHIASGLVSRANAPRALCGRWGNVGEDLASEYPSDAKTCESCLRIAAKKKNGAPQ